VRALGGSGTGLAAEHAVLGGAVCYAVNTILARRRPKSQPMTAAMGVVIAATVMTAPLAAAIDRPWVLTPPSGDTAVAVFAVLVLGVVSTGVATVVYFRLITVAGPSFLSLINYLIPLWAVGLGMIVLGERPGWRAGVALALVLAGIAASELGRPVALPRRDD
jgi:drug/metabolite transporter (DMT)-like permease